MPPPVATLRFRCITRLSFTIVADVRLSVKSQPEEKLWPGRKMGNLYDLQFPFSAFCNYNAGEHAWRGSEAMGQWGIGARERRNVGTLGRLLPGGILVSDGQLVERALQREGGN